MDRGRFSIYKEALISFDVAFLNFLHGSSFRLRLPLPIVSSSVYVYFSLGLRPSSLYPFRFSHSFPSSDDGNFVFLLPCFRGSSILSFLLSHLSPQYFATSGDKLSPITP
jgi:hypothetical protein